jgi:putative spermidine/putrescine transport system permease protein
MSGNSNSATRPRHAVGRGVWLTAVCVFMVLPLAIIVVSSFSAVSYGAWPPPAYSLEWYRNLLGQPGLAEAALLSVQVAGLTTVLTTLLGLGVAVALTRHRFIGRRLTEGLTFAPIVVPKVALGFAIFIYLNRTGLYGEGTLGLVAAHVVITLPFASTLLTAALVRADVDTEAAARDLGAQPMRAFAAATLPQIRPALVATALFVFIVSFDEVDASVFLLPIDRQTLPVWMYTYMQQYQDPTLAALSALLIGASLTAALAAAVILRRSGVLAVLLRRGR